MVGLTKFVCLYLYWMGCCSCWMFVPGNRSSSGACLRRRSRCHEFPPSRSVLSASLRSRQSKIHRLQVGLHGSESGLPWTTNPPSPVVRWVCNAGLESSVTILSGVGTVEMSNEGQRTAADSVWQKWLPSAGAYLIIGDKFRPMYVQDTSKAPIIQCIDRPW